MRPVDAAVSWAGRALGGTWRVQWSDPEPVRQLRRHGQPFIFALWHRDLVPLLWFHRGFPTALLVSTHRDGQLLASTAERWGYEVIRGSSTRNGMEALRTVIRTLRAGGEVAITPDGPRGPAGVIKEGVLAAAQAGRVPVVPVAAAARPVWRLDSWDRMQVPAPLARVRIAYGPAVVVSPGRQGRVKGRADLERALASAEERAWR